MNHRSDRFTLRQILTLLLLFSLIAWLTPLPAALAGDFDIDFDFDFDFDTGGSDWGGSDWDSSDHSSRNRSGSRSGSGRHSGSGSGMAVLIIYALLLLVALIIFANKQHKRGKSGVANTASSNRQVHEYYRGRGSSMRNADSPKIDQQKLLSSIGDMFIRFDQAWESGNMECLLSDFTLPTWTHFNAQLQLKNALREKTHATKPSYFKAGIKCWERTDGMDILHVWIKASRCIWTEDTANECVLSGSSQRPVHILYDWTLVKPSGEQGAVEGYSSCPNCGAEVDPLTFAQCPYCRTELVRPGAGWQISTINAVVQVPDGRILDRIYL